MTELPRLAVVSDIYPVRTRGGELLLYRLLADYPPERLLILRGPGDLWPGQLLPGVRYRVVNYGYALPRVLRSRLVPFWPALELLLARRLSRLVLRAVDEFGPEAILTVPEGRLWAAAPAAAAARGVPLHMIVHDDPPTRLSGNRRSWHGQVSRVLGRRQFGAAYRRAASRLCVSRGMASLYEEQFGVPGEVLYPSRGADSPEPRVRVRAAAFGPPAVAFAGVFNGEGMVRLLRELAVALAGVGAELHLYTRLERSELAPLGMDLPHVRLMGFLPPKEMAERMGETAHALLLPASFLPNEKTDVSTLFPSKLADYTAVGLPVIAWGPAYSSAVQWVRENPGVAEVVTDADAGPVRDALLRLAGDPARAAGLAAAALEAGGRDFGPESAGRTFRAALAGVAGRRVRS